MTFGKNLRAWHVLAALASLMVAALVLVIVRTLHADQREREHTEAVARVAQQLDSDPCSAERMSQADRSLAGSDIADALGRCKDQHRCEAIVGAVKSGHLTGPTRADATAYDALVIRISDNTLVPDDLIKREEQLPCASVSDDAKKAMWKAFVAAAMRSPNAWASGAAPTDQLIDAIKQRAVDGGDSLAATSNTAGTAAKAALVSAKSSNDLRPAVSLCALLDKPGPDCARATQRAAVLERIETAQANRQTAIDDAKQRASKAQAANGWERCVSRCNTRGGDDCLEGNVRPSTPRWRRRRCRGGGSRGPSRLLRSTWSRRPGLRLLEQRSDRGAEHVGELDEGTSSGRAVRDVAGFRDMFISVFARLGLQYEFVLTAGE